MAVRTMRRGRPSPGPTEKGSARRGQHLILPTGTVPIKTILSRSRHATRGRDSSYGESRHDDQVRALRTLEAR
jgi:hypothetical protein